MAGMGIATQHAMGKEKVGMKLIVRINWGVACYQVSSASQYTSTRFWSKAPSCLWLT